MAGRTSLPNWVPGQAPFNCGNEGRARVIKKGIAGFPYYLGVNSLSEIATADDRVCVLNILGGEFAR